MKVPVKGPCFLCKEQYYARLDRHFMRMHPHFDTGHESLIITDNNKSVAPDANKKSELYPKPKEGQIHCCYEKTSLPKTSTIATRDYLATAANHQNLELPIKEVQPFVPNGVFSRDGMK